MLSKEPNPAYPPTSRKTMRYMDIQTKKTNPKHHKRRSLEMLEYTISIKKKMKSNWSITKNYFIRLITAPFTKYNDQLKINAMIHYLNHLGIDWEKPELNHFTLYNGIVLLSVTLPFRFDIEKELYCNCFHS